MDVPFGFCHCGCGNKTRISERDHRLKGHKKGIPLKFIKCHAGSENPGYTLDPLSGCWNWNGYITKSGYAGIVRRNGKQTSAYRAYYEEMRGPITEGLHIDHLCRNPKCVNPFHLEIVTQAENNWRSPIAKLKPTDIFEIRKLIQEGITDSAIADRFFVKRGQIGKIRRGDAWSGLN